MIEVNCEQQTPEWYEIRRGVLTASHFDEIITPKTMKMSASVRKVACRVLAEWLSGTVEQPPSTRAMEWGIIMEPEARSWYEFQTGASVRQVGFCFLDEQREIGCSPDGLIGDDGGLEIKCLQGAAHVEFLLTGEIPPEYVPQIQGSLWITGRKWWDYVSYHPNMPSKIVRVEPDEAWMLNLPAAVMTAARLIATSKEILLAQGYAPAVPVEVKPPNPADYGF